MDKPDTIRVDDAFVRTELMEKIQIFFEQSVRWAYGWESSAKDAPFCHWNHDFLKTSRLNAEDSQQLLFSQTGQQRILIARAPYLEPQLIVLDEARSHLDVALERRINGHLLGLNITKVVMALVSDRVEALRILKQSGNFSRQERAQMAGRMASLRKLVRKDLVVDRELTCTALSKRARLALDIIQDGELTGYEKYFRRQEMPAAALP
jgi:ABC-type uncharacterized transport system ATPase subunit